MFPLDVHFVSILCKYGFRKGDLFVLSWERVRLYGSLLEYVL